MKQAVKKLQCQNKQKLLILDLRKVIEEKAILLKVIAIQLKELVLQENKKT